MKLDGFYNVVNPGSWCSPFFRKIRERISPRVSVNIAEYVGWWIGVGMLWCIGMGEENLVSALPRVISFFIDHLVLSEGDL